MVDIAIGRKEIMKLLDVSNWGTVRKWTKEAVLAERNHEELLRILKNFKGRKKDKIKELILKYNINTKEDFLYVPDSEIMNEKGMGNIFLLQFKKVLVEEGCPYEEDELDEELKKIKEKQRVNTETFKRLRFEILKRDGFRCQYCGRSPNNNPDVELQIDHVHPQAKGGTYSEDNLITSCRECNIGKSDILLKKKGVLVD